MTTARTLEYPHEPPRRRTRRTTLIVTAVIVVATLLVGFIAADRVVDFTTEQKIAASLEPYGDADVNVEGFPVLTQMAGGTLDTVHVTADRAQYENVDFTDVDAKLFDVPVDTSRPIGTVEASAVIPLSTIDSLATEHASLPEGMAFTTVDGGLYLQGSLLGQDLLIGIESKAESRRAVVNATSIRLGSAEVDIDSLPSFLTSSISDIVIDLDFLPVGLELTDIEATDAGLEISLHGTGVSVK
ncbi:DUF2993 domain-containing protein [Brevibacterium aurantiacum]|uniref:DUF2993 domain-containing protein n=1 Tax=Brevibacterium aurantiacum TaxID=273384 RepID=A0A556CEV3_BREAU|nr:DUF2993 domain-containing protein [Brevibacterium aurantiacum]TSI15953.1 DUF2993 domain-containing protein [Brevibacterium aurantiacum]